MHLALTYLARELRQHASALKIIYSRVKRHDHGHALRVVLPRACLRVTPVALQGFSSYSLPYNASFTIGTAAWDPTTVATFFKQVLDGYGPKMTAFREAILDTTCKPFKDLPPYSCERLKVLEKPFLEVLS